MKDFLKQLAAGFGIVLLLAVVGVAALYIVLQALGGLSK